VAERLELSMEDQQVRLDSTVIVVAGTNGKGSVCSMLEQILIEAGYSTSLYSSPHILQFEERLRFSGNLCQANDWLEAFKYVETARLLSPVEQLTFFEAATVAAIFLVSKKKPEIAIFEVGLGGRLDAVNLLANDCSVITSVSVDHQSFLGSCREQIGWEKAHIARSKKPFIIADLNPPKTVLEFAVKIEADIVRYGSDFKFHSNDGQWDWVGRKKNRLGLAFPALRGIHQLLNASVALASLESLSSQFPVSQDAVRKGLAKVELPARFQVLPGKPTVILDVAHNPESAKMLSDSLDRIGFYPNTYAVVGILSDKDAIEILKKTVAKIDYWLFATLDEDLAANRSRSGESLLKALQVVKPEAKAKCYKNPLEAFNTAAQLASSNDRIVVFGSFITVSSVWVEAHKLGKP
jgi:dihydrofolate synthase/folylpolyglutamate synthase